MLTGNTHQDFLRLQERIQKLERLVKAPEDYKTLESSQLGNGWSLFGASSAYQARFYKDREVIRFTGQLYYSAGSEPGRPIKTMPPGYRIGTTNAEGRGQCVVLIPQAEDGLISTPDTDVGTSPTAEPWGGPRLMGLWSSGMMEILLGGAVPNNSLWTLDLISYRVGT